MHICLLAEAQCEETIKTGQDVTVPQNNQAKECTFIPSSSPHLTFQSPTDIFKDLFPGSHIDKKLPVDTELKKDRSIDLFSNTIKFKNSIIKTYQNYNL